MNSAPFDQIRLRRVLLGLALVTALAGLAYQLLLSDPARAAGPYTVNSLGDGSDANLGDGTCETAIVGECTLRAALEQAQAPSSPGPDSIIITATGTITLTGNLPAIAETVVITGPGSASLTIDGVDSYTHFFVGAGISAQISGLALANGKANYSETFGGLCGGAIHNKGTLTLDSVTITGSSSGGRGGAICGDVDSITLVQNGSQIGAPGTPNTANSGGGVFTHYGTITITAAMVSYNAATDAGGGIYNYGGVFIVDSTVANNHAGSYGGGIFTRQSGGVLTVINSTVSGNTADGHGGGIVNTNNAETLTLDSCTIANNAADYDDDGSGDGGGIYNEGPYTETVAIYVGNTIIAGNADQSGDRDCYNDEIEPIIITSLGHNLVWNPGNCAFSAIGDVASVDPLLDSLADNGGSTWTHALQVGSPAIDAIPVVSCTVATDQRGVLRPQGPGCDVGSYETTYPHLYLPLVLNDYMVAPDLVVQGVVATSDGVQVVIRNQGNGPARQEFWVDAYINPNPVPAHVNQIWNDLADEGLVWGVTADMQPGDTITLTVGDAYYTADYSQVAWPLAAGTPVYVQVDSWNADTTYGAVLESHEIGGGVYNNIGSTVSTLGGQGALPSGTEGAEGQVDVGLCLPPRPPDVFGQTHSIDAPFLR